MPDDPKKGGKPGRDRINVNEEHQLRDGSKILGVSADCLKEAVKKVGPMVADVRRDSGRNRGGTVAVRDKSEGTGSIAEKAEQNTYKHTIHEQSKVASKAGPIAEQRRRVLEGEAAKRGLQIQQKESKGRPKSSNHAKRRTVVRGGGSS